MIPRNNSTTSSLKANTNNQSRDNKIIFNDLMKLRNISFENGNVLYENKSEMDYIGFIIIVCAFLLFVFSNMNILGYYY